MKLPLLSVDQEVATNYEYCIPTSGYQALADAAKLDDSALDSITIKLSSRLTLNTYGRTTIGLFSAENEKLERHALIEVFVRNFIGFGEYGFSIQPGIKQELSSEKLDSFNASSLLLHELMHLSRNEARQKGENPWLLPKSRISNIYLPRYLQDNEERTVIHVTGQTLQDSPDLGKTIELFEKK